MTVHLIQSRADFVDLREEWNDLLTKSAIHVPFLRHEYLVNWWDTLGGGEWEQGDLRIILERDQTQKLIAAAPLFAVGQQLRFLGSLEISDYLDLLGAAETLPRFVEEIFGLLESAGFPSWQELILDNLLETSPSLQHIEESARKRGYTCAQHPLQPAPYLPLPSSWEGYLGKLEERYRREIERKIRKAETYFLPVEWYQAADPETLEAEMDEFLNLMANNPQKKAFLTPAMQGQMKKLAAAAFQAGWLQLAFLTMGDLKIAGYLNFDYDGKIWVYNSGINPMFENLSPGWVLLAKIIQHAIEGGRTELDFMRGDEGYKYQFGGRDKAVLRLHVSK